MSRLNSWFDIYIYMIKLYTTVPMNISNTVPRYYWTPLDVARYLVFFPLQRDYKIPSKLHDRQVSYDNIITSNIIICTTIECDQITSTTYTRADYRSRARNIVIPIHDSVPLHIRFSQRIVYDVLSSARTTTV